MAGGAGGSVRAGAGVGAADGSFSEVVGDAALLVDPYDVRKIAQAMWLVLTQPVLVAELRA